MQYSRGVGWRPLQSRIFFFFANAGRWKAGEALDAVLQRYQGRHKLLLGLKLLNAANQNSLRYLVIELKRCNVDDTREKNF